MSLVFDRHRTIWRTIAVAVIAIVAGVSLWLATQTPFWGSIDSPKGKYRVELYGASALDKLLRSSAMEMPGYAQLVENKTDKVLGRSRLTDLYDNGSVLWNTDGSSTVMVGLDITFENIAPE